MSKRILSYEEARPRMKPGDVIAFGGKDFISETIKAFTGSEVSHVAVIFQTSVRNGGPTNEFFNEIYESVLRNDNSGGVRRLRLSQRLSLDGNNPMNPENDAVWWLPLRKDIRNRRFDEDAFGAFLRQHQDKPYDIPQALLAWADAFDNLPFQLRGPTYTREDFGKFFCSELVAGALEEAEAIGSINASEVLPVELCRWRIYKPVYYQLQGDPAKNIPRYNSLNPV